MKTSGITFWIFSFGSLVNDDDAMQSTGMSSRKAMSRPRPTLKPNIGQTDVKVMIPLRRQQ